MPNRAGSDQNRRPRSTFSATNPPTSATSPVNAASRFCHHVQSNEVAPIISARNTSTKNGVARVKMSCVAE
jgi:hypothetical protein